MADDDERRVGGAKGRAPEPEAPAAITVADLGPDAPPQMVELARQNKVLSNQLESKVRASYPRALQSTRPFAAFQLFTLLLLERLHHPSVRLGTDSSPHFNMQYVHYCNTPETTRTVS